MLAAARSWHSVGASRRTLLVLACLLSFALQNFVAQTHIHPLVLSHHAAAAVNHAGTPAPNKNKTGQDDLACPACQAAALVGLVLGPTGLLLFLPGVSHSVAPVLEQSEAPQQSPAHAWRSRGPPQA